MSTIRPARFRDIPEIVSLCEEAYTRSSFSDRFELDPASIKRVLLEAINNQSSRPGAALVLVGEGVNGIESIFAGFVTQLYEAMDAYIASNLIWYAAPDASPKTTVGLLRAFEEWLSRSEYPVLIRVALADAVQDPERMSKILDRMGYRRSGILLEKET